MNDQSLPSIFSASASARGGAPRALDRRLYLWLASTRSFMEVSSMGQPGSAEDRADAAASCQEAAVDETL